MNNQTPIISPIAGLFRSRKFVAAIVGVVATFIVQAVPAFASAKDQITEVIVTLFGLAIGGWAVEDAAQSFAARNK